MAEGADDREPRAGGGVHAAGDGGTAPALTEKIDAALLERIRSGDADAFDEVARQEAPKLYRFALYLTGGREEDAEDLVQDTLVRALRTMHGFEGRAALSTYLSRALANLWKNRLRSKSRSRLVEWFRAGTRTAAGEEAAFDPPDEAPTPLDRMEAEDRAVLVREAVAKLEPDRRLALLLRETEGLSYEEIAAATGVPVGTVRSRLARAREDLRKMLRGRV